MMITAKISMLTLLWLSLLYFTTGCNTMKGVGRDVENAGEAVQDAATK